MAGIVWKNRDNLPYAWKVVTKGVCDGCALGVAGLKDWTVKGPHLCMTRLNLLRLNTMPPMDENVLSDVSALHGMDNAALRALGRLAYPMVREKDAAGFRRITWEEANRRISGKIRSTEPQRLAFFVTARGVTNEVYYMAQKVARFLGTNHIDNAARICHSPSGSAMKEALGVAASTCSYRDWYGSDLVIFFGSNPANDQPVSTKYLHEAKKLGTRVVLVNPYLEPGMKRYWVPSNLDSALFGSGLADFWFPVSQGGDIAFLSGVMKILCEEGWVNTSFVDRHTTGFEELAAQLGALEWEPLERAAGLDRAAMREFAELIRDAKNAVLVWSMGITQHPFGGDAVQAILNLALARGYIGTEKNGVMPIRGHSSVQGGAEMGAYATTFPGYLPVNAANAAALSAQYGFEVPDWRGMTATEMVDACGRGELDVFYCLGGNFLRTLPDPVHVRTAMSHAAVRVHQDIVVTDQMLIPARDAVFLLPAKTRYEQDDGGTETSTERRVMFSPELPRQVGEARAEWRILRDIAIEVDPARGAWFGCEDGWKMREEIARVVPFYDGIQNLRTTGDAFQYGGPHLCADGNFPTSDGRGHFRAIVPPQIHRDPGVFRVSTRRGKQFNTLIYAEVDPLNDAPRDAILMNETDAAALGVAAGQEITLVSDVGRYRGRVHPAPIAPGNFQVHWPEGNGLIRRGVVDRMGGVPDYNAHVRVEKD